MSAQSSSKGRASAIAVDDSGRRKGMAIRRIPGVQEHQRPDQFVAGSRLTGERSFLKLPSVRAPRGTRVA